MTRSRTFIAVAVAVVVVAIGIGGFVAYDQILRGDSADALTLPTASAYTGASATTGAGAT